MNELPENWVKSTVGELFETIGGGTPSTAISEFWQGRIPWISSADIDEGHHLSISRFITEEAILSSATNLVPAGSVIIVTRVGLGKVAITDVPLCFSQDNQALLVREEFFDRRYVLFYMSTAVREFKHISRGTTISGVTKKQLLETDFVLPPRLEQTRIVDEIEKQFTRLDAATAALKRAQANLKRYRASVLKAACEGHLASSGTLSAPYDIVPVGKILREPLANGRSPKGTEYGCKILRLTAIKKGRIDPDEHRLGTVIQPLIESLTIRPNDILISRGNGSKSLVGLAGLVGNGGAEMEPVLFPDTMIRARLDGKLCDPRFFVLIWNSRFVRDQIERTARTTAGIHKISQADIEQFQIPLPSIEEQADIVTAAERALSNVQHTDDALMHLVARSASLRASILADAFSGRLVPQGQHDESAATLLERIRAELKRGRSEERKAAPLEEGAYV